LKTTLRVCSLLMQRRRYAILQVMRTWFYVLHHRFGSKSFELKPISYSPLGDPLLYARGKQQLQEYAEALDAVPGTSWDPNGVVLDHPTDPDKEIVLATFYDVAPGMIYYYERNKPKEQEQPQENPQENPDENPADNPTIPFMPIPDLPIIPEFPIPFPSLFPIPI
jgi:hypothetical protein